MCGISNRSAIDAAIPEVSIELGPKMTSTPSAASWQTEISNHVWKYQTEWIVNIYLPTCWTLKLSVLEMLYIIGTIWYCNDLELILSTACLKAIWEMSSSPWNNPPKREKKVLNRRLSLISLKVSQSIGAWLLVWMMSKSFDKTN